MKKYLVIKTVQVEYYYNVEAKNKKEAIRKATERNFDEDGYQWFDTISDEAIEDNSIYVREEFKEW